jgi:hypothetical protein
MRMSISIPEALKARMDRVREDVNWSSIACRAFEQKLGEIASRKERKNMTDLIERLRASKLQQESDLFKDGFEWGKEWAKNEATAKQLERLERMYNRLSTEPIHDWQRFFRFDADRPYATYELFYFELAPDDKSRTQAAAREFWEHAAGDDGDRDIQEGEWVRGFAEGALDIWNHVKNKI